MIRAVLIDDEPQSTKALAIKLASVAGDIDVIASICEPEKAVSALPGLSPDVVFLDIEMPGLNGFQLMEQLSELPFEIIFITAYHEYILNALRISALDYLLKPVDKEELNQTLFRLRKKLSVKQGVSQKKEQLRLLRESVHQAPTRLALTTVYGIQFVKVCDIVRVEAMSNYAAFHLSNKQKIIVSKTLKEFEPVLALNNFMRVNRSSIINIEFVSGLRKTDGGSIILQDGTEVDIAPQRKQELLDRLHSF